MTSAVRSARDIDFAKGDGLIAAVVRDSRTGAVLMVAWMNEESLERTLASGETWFWSRSRRELWHKGATSGATQRVIRVATDCDSDALLIDVEPRGPACHTGARSCFGDAGSPLTKLMTTLRQRNQERPAGSYSTSLFERGRPAILKKVGEEAAEVIVATAAEGRDRVVSETADLLYHLSVLLVSENLDWSDIFEELEARSR